MADRSFFVAFTVFAPFRVTGLFSSIFVVSSAGLPTVDVNRAGVSLLTTKLTIDANEKDSSTAATSYAWVGSPAPAFMDFAVGDVISFDIDVGGTGAKGLIVYMLGFDL